MELLRHLFRSELRAVLAVALLLLVLVGLGLAASQSQTFTLDFGSADLSALASNAYLVTPSTNFPTPIPNTELAYGFQGATGLAALATGGPHKLTADAIVGSSKTSFVLSGLSPQSNYQVTVTAGSVSVPVSTAFSVGNSSAILNAEAGFFPTRSLVGTSDENGQLTLVFQPTIYSSWVVNGLSVRSTSQTTTAPSSFEVALNPREAEIAAGETASFAVEATPVGGDYPYPVKLSLTTVPKGFVAVIVPPALSVLPASASVKITAAINVPSLAYSFALRAAGADPLQLNRLLTFTVRVVAPATAVVSSPSGEPPAETPVEPSPAETSPVVLTPAQIAQDARVLAAVQAAVAQAVPSAKVFSDFRLIALDLRVPSLGVPPPAPPTLELERMGLVKSVVDAAPAAPSQPPRQGFWARFFKALVVQPVR